METGNCESFRPVVSELYADTRVENCCVLAPCFADVKMFLSVNKIETAGKSGNGGRRRFSVMRVFDVRSRIYY